VSVHQDYLPNQDFDAFLFALHQKNNLLKCKSIRLIKKAVETGEPDAQIEAASGSLRSGFKR